MKILISEFEISVALDIGTPAVRARAKKEGWMYVNKPTQGGSKRFYVLSLLPDYIKACLVDLYGLADRDEQEAGS